MKTPTPDTFSLRDKKRAQTRLNLVGAMMERLNERTLEEIPVSELCEAAGISPATFFNYFPAKPDLLTHYLQLWSLEVGALARRVMQEEDTALGALEALFVYTGERMSMAPGVTREILSHQARMPPDLVVEPVEAVERVLLLPDEDDVLSLPDGGLGEVLPQLVIAAVKNGELPRCTDVPSTTLALASVFFGVPMIFGSRDPSAIANLYRRQLALVFAGVRAEEGSQ